MDYLQFSVLIGKTLVSVRGAEKGGDEIIFTCDDGSVFKMYHESDCCESVSIEDVSGDIADLIGSPIVMAEVATSCENPTGVTPPEYQDSFTWTFYKLATAKGYVDIRWYGESNGYYSESVDFKQEV